MLEQFATIKKLLPPDVVQYVTVNAIVDGVSLVEDANGNEWTVRGDAVAVGQKAWVKGDAIVGSAPASLGTYYITI